MKLPDKITIKFTKIAVNTAQQYTSNDGCLLATCLKRRGFKNVSVGGYGYVQIGSAEYYPLTDFNSNLVKNREAVEAPFYKKEIIGTKLVLVRKK
jgi:hypothetical protein